MAHLDDMQVKRLAHMQANAKRRMERCESQVVEQAHRFADRLKSGHVITVDEMKSHASGIVSAYEMYARARNERIVIDEMVDLLGFSFDEKEVR